MDGWRLRGGLFLSIVVVLASHIGDKNSDGQKKKKKKSTNWILLLK